MPRCLCLPALRVTPSSGICCTDVALGLAAVPAVPAGTAEEVDPVVVLARASVSALTVAARAEADLLSLKGGAGAEPVAGVVVESPLARFCRRHTLSPRQRGGRFSSEGWSRQLPANQSPGTCHRGGSSLTGEGEEETGAAEADDGGALAGLDRSRSGARLSCGRDLRLMQQEQQQQMLALRQTPPGPPVAAASTAATEASWTTLTGALDVSVMGRLSEQLRGFGRLATSAASSGPGIPTVITAAHPRFVAVGTSKGVVVLLDSVRDQGWNGELCSRGLRPLPLSGFSRGLVHPVESRYGPGCHTRRCCILPRLLRRDQRRHTSARVLGERWDVHSSVWPPPRTEHVCVQVAAGGANSGDGAVTSLDASPCLDMLVAGFHSGRFALFDVSGVTVGGKKAAVLKSTELHRAPVSAVRFVSATEPAVMSVRGQKRWAS